MDVKEIDLLDIHWDIYWINVLTSRAGKTKEKLDSGPANNLVKKNQK
jgi:hypothetical protein